MTINYQYQITLENGEIYSEQGKDDESAIALLVNRFPGYVRHGDSLGYIKIESIELDIKFYCTTNTKVYDWYNKPHTLSCCQLHWRQQQMFDDCLNKMMECVIKLDYKGLAKVATDFSSRSKNDLLLDNIAEAWNSYCSVLFYLGVDTSEDINLANG